MHGSLSNPRFENPVVAKGVLPDQNPELKFVLPKEGIVAFEGIATETVVDPDAPAAEVLNIDGRRPGL